MKSMLRRWRERTALRVLLSVFTFTLAMTPATVVAQNLGQRRRRVKPYKARRRRRPREPS